MNLHNTLFVREVAYVVGKRFIKLTYKAYYDFSVQKQHVHNMRKI